MKADLRAYLIGDSGVSALIGSRLYWSRAPQAPTYPLVIYTAITESEEEILDASTSGLRQRTIQFTAWAATDVVAEQIIQAIKDALLVLATPHMTGSPFPSVGVLRGANVLNVGYEVEDPDRRYQGCGADFLISFA